MFNIRSKFNFPQWCLWKKSASVLWDFWLLDLADHILWVSSIGPSISCPSNELVVSSRDLSKFGFRKIISVCQAREYHMGDIAASVWNQLCGWLIQCAPSVIRTPKLPFLLPQADLPSLLAMTVQADPSLWGSCSDVRGFSFLAMENFSRI